ncbi:Flp1 family type IVb pilin [Paenibacillus sp. FJAT-26967]|uniref:Flp1 family type IVb pilin n=1 Tax=Paenibacillus sp. FJAT-26967 TaxID=1729690 RepID=UPI000837D373|nr:Flp1 family type IVb pilin [Paenibacillus sp. FJAT-26967]
MKPWLLKFWNDEEGLGTLEILLIVAVLIAIAVIFRKWIIKWFNDLIGKAGESFDKTGTDSEIKSPT